MYFLIFERSPLTKIHLSYKSLSRIQDSDNGVPGTGISCFSLKFNPRAHEKGEGREGGGGGEKRGGREKLLPKLKAEVYSKNDRQKYSNGQSRGYIP